MSFVSMYSDSKAKETIQPTPFRKARSTALAVHMYVQMIHKSSVLCWGLLEEHIADYSTLYNMYISSDISSKQSCEKTEMQRGKKRPH